MPKWKKTESEKRLEQIEKNRIRFAAEFGAVIAKIIVLYGINKPQIGDAMGYTRSLFYKRLKNPENFSLSDLQKLSSNFGMVKDEVQKCILLYIS